MYLQDVKNRNYISYDKSQFYTSNNRTLIASGRITESITTFLFDCPKCKNRNIAFESHRLWLVLSRKERKMFTELKLDISRFEPEQRTQRISEFLETFDPFVDCAKSELIYRKPNKKRVAKHIVIPLT